MRFDTLSHALAAIRAFETECDAAGIYAYRFETTYLGKLAVLILDAETGALRGEL